MLTWHNVWMARHGRELSVELRRVGGEVSKGSRSLMALAVVVAVAVLREGSEVVLFLYGVVVSSHDSGTSSFFGGALGLFLGVAVCILTYTGLLTIPVRHLFKVTSLLIAFMAAGMAAQAIAFLEQADIATTLSRTIWNTSAILPDNSIPGRILHTLLGYTDSPTQLQGLAYLATLLAIFCLMKLMSPTAKQKPEISPLIEQRGNGKLAPYCSKIEQTSQRFTAQNRVILSSLRDRGCNFIASVSDLRQE